MKKSYKILSLILYIALLFFTLNIFTNNVSANSSRLTGVKTFPKIISGTWYTYNNFGYGKKKISKIVLNAKRTGFHPYVDHPEYLNHYLEKNEIKKHKKYFAKASGWYYILKIGKWYNVRGYMSVGDGDSYNVKNINGIKVLTDAEGADNHVFVHYYKSKKIAKKMGEKRYPGFKYSNI